VTGELSYAILPCADLDATVSFYELLGFRCTYRQRRPNPYAVVAREDLQIHFGGIEGFDPAESYASVIIAVPDLDVWYADFAQRLRAALGKVPATGIPRLLRPRKRHGTVRGFTLVDPGGNWLRFFRSGETEDDGGAEAATGLERVVDNAARLADAAGDEQGARRVLAAGVDRYRDEPAGVRVKAMAFLAELDARLGDRASADTWIRAALAIADGISAEARDALGHARELVTGEP
jgi:catechol 2,3-dioxygenase-like lactoylglutathione lyase family enzyme